MPVFGKIILKRQTKAKQRINLKLFRFSMRASVEAAA
jgi:hypothetical protein